jgi:hypothetical protein
MKRFLIKRFQKRLLIKRFRKRFQKRFRAATEGSGT